MLIALNLLHESLWKKYHLSFTCYMLNVIFLYFHMFYSFQNDWCSRSREIDIPKRIIISVRPKKNVIIRIRSNNGSNPSVSCSVRHELKLLEIVIIVIHFPRHKWDFRAKTSQSIKLGHWRNHSRTAERSKSMLVRPSTVCHVAS